MRMATGAWGKVLSGLVIAGAGLGWGVGAASECRGQYAALGIVGGLTRPIFLTWAPGDFKRVYVLEKAGRIRLVDTTVSPPSLNPTAFLDIRTLVQTVTADNDEIGLLGLAFHPQYQSNGKFYVYYTAPMISGLPNSATYYCTVAEYTVRDPSTLIVNPSLNAADPASARIVMQIPHPQTNHNAGWLGFGPDGYLYITVGDGGNANDQGPGHNATIGNAQDTGVPLGKMMRIDISVTTTPAQGPFVPGSIASYGIPADNPTIPTPSGATGSRQEIWAYGLRNPWRDSFDRLTGDIWIADVGQSDWEEIDFQPALTAANTSTVAGRNYGWHCTEGTFSFNNNGGLCNSLTFVNPLAEYGHGQTVTSPPPQVLTGVSGCAIIGGYVYRGCAIPQLQGKYIFGDYCSAHVFAITPGAGGTLGSWSDITSTVWGGSPTSTPPVPSYTAPANSLVGFGQDAYGELYICDQTGGRVFKLVPTSSGRIPLGNCDFNHNGQVTVQDIFDFLTAWFNLAPGADFNQSGTVTVQDVFDFLGCWFSGCQN